MATVSLTRIYEVSCGHYLPGLPKGDRCSRPHGHNYQVRVTVTGEPDGKGMLIEAAALDLAVRPVLLVIDHRNLNGLRLPTRAGRALTANPTVEHLAIWLYEALALAWPKASRRIVAHRVQVWETVDLFAEVGR